MPSHPFFDIQMKQQRRTLFLRSNNSGIGDIGVSYKLEENRGYRLLTLDALRNTIAPVVPPAEPILVCCCQQTEMGTLLRPVSPSVYVSIPSFRLTCRSPASIISSYGQVLTFTAVLLTASFASDTWTGVDRSLSHLYELGFGEVTSATLVHMAVPGSWGLLLITILANIPQLLLSFCYLTFNCIFTCMLVAQEWNSYSHRRRHLRVTSPQGNQRSTYRLQLPYRYSMPFLVLSGILHWLTSQSLFLARVTTYDKYGRRNEEQSISTLG